MKVGAELVCPEATSVRCQGKVQHKEKTALFELQILCLSNGKAGFGNARRMLFKAYSRWKDRLCSGCKNVSAQGFMLVIKSRVGQGCQQRCSLPVES